jgi:hypothetical protein
MAVREESPGYRREALEHGYRTVVVLPMEYRNPADPRTVLSVRARAVETDTPDRRFALQLALQFYRIIDPRNSQGT